MWLLYNNSRQKKKELWSQVTGEYSENIIKKYIKKFEVIKKENSVFFVNEPHLFMLQGWINLITPHKKTLLFQEFFSQINDFIILENIENLWFFFPP